MRKPFVIATAVALVAGVGVSQFAASAGSPYPPPSTTLPVARGECTAVGANGNLDEAGDIESVVVFLDVGPHVDGQCKWTINSDDEAELAILIAIFEMLGIVDGTGDGEFEVH